MASKQARVLVIILFPVAGLLQIQGCAKKLMDNATFQVAPSPILPSAIGLNYEEITIGHKDRKVRAWLIEDTKFNDSKTAVLLFNGIGGNLSGWRYFQRHLAESGISSVCFEYGPQADTLKKRGSSRLGDVTKDVTSIIDTLTNKYGNGLNLFLLAHSVGNAVMLEMYENIDTKTVKGIIVCNAFGSMIEWGVEHGKIPKGLAFVFPSYYDNLSNIKNVTVPVLIMHSKSDSINFFSSALEIYKAANENKQLVQFENFKHNDIFRNANLLYWTPIVDFIKLHKE